MLAVCPNKMRAKVVFRWSTTLLFQFNFPYEGRAFHLSEWRCIKSVTYFHYLLHGHSFSVLFVFSRNSRIFRLNPSNYCMANDYPLRPKTAVTCFQVTWQRPEGTHRLPDLHPIKPWPHLQFGVEFPTSSVPHHCS